MADEITMTESVARVLATLIIESDASMVDVTQQIIVISIYFLIAVLGSTAAQLFTNKQAEFNSVNFWVSHFPDRSDVFHLRCDFVAKALLGSLVALLAVAPETERQALTAGFGWAAAISAMFGDRS